MENSYVHGLPSEKLYEYYVKPAENNVGLIITGSTLVDGYGDCVKNGRFPYCALDDDCYVEPWKKVVDKVHKLGAKIGLFVALCRRIL